jgi:glucose/arabinose dehydrogenase
LGFVTGRAAAAAGALAPAAILALILALAAAAPAMGADAPFRVAEGAPVALGLHREAEGFVQPVFLTEAPDGSGRRFVVEQGGRVRILTPGAAHHPVYLDLRPVLTSGGERGLLGLAFHPQFGKNGRLYVDFTDRAGRIILARLTADPKGDGPVDPGTLKALLAIDNPAPNHNGGMIAFGPDGYLYVGTGDGGGAGDPFQNGQNTFSHLGKLLRLDVDHPADGRPYGIPPDNPFLNLSNHRPEIWALGLRNPWRFSFDTGTGDLYIADVGQDDWEEVNREAAGGKGGVNYGWSRMEGRHCFPPRGRKSTCDVGTLPIVEYGHQFGCSVTGGYVYRGRAIPKLDGIYLLADFCSGIVWGLYPREGGRYRMRRLLETDLSISSFGQDAAGEVYLVDHRGGAVWRIVPAGWTPPENPKKQPKAEPAPAAPEPAPPPPAEPAAPSGA